MKKEIEIDITQDDLLEKILINDNTNKYDMKLIVEHVLGFMTLHDNMPNELVQEWLDVLQNYTAEFVMLFKEDNNG